MKKFLLLLTLLILTNSSNLLARDINLDSIYIKNSNNYQQLISLKYDLYATAKSKKLLKNVIFAHWLNGKTITTIQEFNSLNILATYNLETNKIKIIKTFIGTISSALFSKNGKSVIIRNILTKEDGYPLIKTTLIKINFKKSYRINSSYPFTDISFSPDGNFIYYHKKLKGIYKLNPITKKEFQIISIDRYKEIIKKGDLTIVHPSPNEKKFLILSGSGGNYRSKLLSNSINKKITHISSSNEVIWLNNFNFLFQHGNPMNYRISKYSLKDNLVSNISKKSLNTNLTSSLKKGNYTFLENQIVILKQSKSKQFITYLEGEDASFSPDKTKFISLFMGNLFLTDLSKISNNNFKMHKILKKILDKYKLLYKRNELWLNIFTKHYLKLKISTYKSLLKLK